MTSREQFETWVNRRPLSKLIGFCERDGDGYVHLQHTALWDVWQASRDVIEIELPPLMYINEPGISFCAYGRAGVLNGIYEQGLKVKG